ncbi:MAG: VacJ family lipoprotein [Alphaproteobacteria bacterium]
MTTARHRHVRTRGLTGLLGLAIACLLTLATESRAAQAEDASLPIPPGVEEPTPEAAAAARAAGDPLEPMNRAIFSFNEKVDAWVLRPTAVAWDKVVPTPVENGLDNAFENIRFPIHLVNNALQGKIDATGTTIFRFLINSTIGIAGFFDVAKHLGMPRRNADFGQTLGVWGVPPGPYLVWPILGSSSVRDSAGMAVDSYINISGLFVDWPFLAGQRVLETVNSRALLLGEIDRAREASFDFYVAVRAAYEGRRAAAVSGRAAGTRQAEEDLYFPETGESAAPGAAPASPGGPR